jgi:hypothetical protein
MRKRVDPAKFISVWYETQNTADAGRRLGISRQRVYQIYAQMVKNKVPLPKTRRRTKYDWPAIRLMAKDLASKVSK